MATISEVAVQLAWPQGTKRSQRAWPGGSATTAFKKAKAQVYTDSELVYFGSHFKAGASCDMFAATCIRYSGCDPEVPPGISKLYTHLRDSKKWQEVPYDPHKKHAYKQLQPGDIMFCKHYYEHKRASNLPSHVFIYVNVNGKPRTAQASARSKYGGIDSFRAGKGEKWVKVFRPTDAAYSGGNSIVSGGYGVSDGGGSIVLEKGIETLMSSGSYDWIGDDTSTKETEAQKRVESIRTFLQSINTMADPTITSVAPTDVIVVSEQSLNPRQEYIDKVNKNKNKQGSNISVFPSLVQAPTIILSFNGITIGGYGNTGDKYPNYITSMSVSKVNGRINTYTINLNYQVRANEDPNFLDTLLGSTGYLKPLSIKYGDSMSPGMYYKEEHALITDVKSNANVGSASITYTITAISSVLLADQTKYNFVERIGKPSTLINELLYESGQVSTQLLEAFPAMSNRTWVNSKNLIPSNDEEVIVGGMSNVSPLTYLSHLVSCMSNTNRQSSSYFMTYEDTSQGAYFNITEVSPKAKFDGVYEINVGYPEDDFVTNFQLCDNMYWPLVYKYNDNIPRWEYDIDDNGELLKTKTNSLYTDNKYLSESLINSNWWTSVTEFPISARVTLKGLTAPLMLMTYIRINTLFYGQKDIASGLYVVTGEDDTVGGDGCSTTLTLLRVSD